SVCNEWTRHGGCVCPTRRSSDLHQLAYSEDPLLANALDAGGEYAFRIRGEEQMWTPDAIAKLQHSVRAGNYSTYKEYAQLINDRSEVHTSELQSRENLVCRLLLE